MKLIFWRHTRKIATCTAGKAYGRVYMNVYICMYVRNSHEFIPR